MAGGADPRRLGPYRIEGRLGHGGMGIVYRARREEGGGPVAIKLLPDELARTDEYVRRFRREAEMARRVAHPNLVRGLDFGAEDGRLYYVMEYVDGIKLSALIEGRGRLADSGAAGIALQISGALQAIHEAGMVHRDVHPANMLLRRDGSAKLADWGLARPAAGERAALTAVDVSVGTAHYMAPEQIERGSEVDIRADVYALGATMYHMAAGRPPFDGLGRMEALRRRVKAEPEDVGSAAPGIDEGLARVIRKAMARRPADRYATPAEMGAALGAIAGRR